MKQPAPRGKRLKPHLSVWTASVWVCQSLDWFAYGNSWRHAYTNWYRAAYPRREVPKL